LNGRIKEETKTHVTIWRRTILDRGRSANVLRKVLDRLKGQQVVSIVSTTSQF
jgi:hypothetical protein